MKMKDRHSTLQQATREGPLLCRFSLASQLWYLASRVPFRCQELGILYKGSGLLSTKWQKPKDLSQRSGPFLVILWILRTLDCFLRLVIDLPRQRLQCQSPQGCRSDRTRCLESWSLRVEGCTWRRCRTQTGHSPGPRTSDHGFSCQFQDQLNNQILFKAKIETTNKGDKNGKIFRHFWVIHTHDDSAKMRDIWGKGNQNCFRIRLLTKSKKFYLPFFSQWNNL